MIRERAEPVFARDQRDALAAGYSDPIQFDRIRIHASASNPEFLDLSPAWGRLAKRITDLVVVFPAACRLG
jgi:hypothetical protein